MYTIVDSYRNHQQLSYWCRCLGPQGPMTQDASTGYFSVDGDCLFLLWIRVEDSVFSDAIFCESSFLLRTYGDTFRTAEVFKISNDSSGYFASSSSAVSLLGKIDEIKVDPAPLDAPRENSVDLFNVMGSPSEVVNGLRHYCLAVRFSGPICVEWFTQEADYAAPLVRSFCRLVRTQGEDYASSFDDVRVGGSSLLRVGMPSGSRTAVIPLVSSADSMAPVSASLIYAGKRDAGSRWSFSCDERIEAEGDEYTLTEPTGRKVRYSPAAAQKVRDLLGFLPAKSDGESYYVSDCDATCLVAGGPFSKVYSSSLESRIFDHYGMPAHVYRGQTTLLSFITLSGSLVITNGVGDEATLSYDSGAPSGASLSKDDALVASCQIGGTQTSKVVVWKDASGSEAQRLTVGLDGSGRPVSLVFSKGPSAYVQYDAAGRVSRLEWGEEAIGCNPFREYSYQGYSASISDHLGHRRFYAYDNLIRPAGEHGCGVARGSLYRRYPYLDPIESGSHAIVGDGLIFNGCFSRDEDLDSSSSRSWKKSGAANCAYDYREGGPAGPRFLHISKGAGVLSLSNVVPPGLQDGEYEMTGFLRNDGESAIEIVVSAEVRWWSLTPSHGFLPILARVYSVTVPLEPGGWRPFALSGVSPIGGSASGTPIRCTLSLSMPSAASSCSFAGVSFHRDAPHYDRNLLLNGCFSKGSTYWDCSGTASVSTVSDEAFPKELGRKAIRLRGESSIEQVVTVAAAPGESFFLSLFVKGSATENGSITALVYLNGAPVGSPRVFGPRLPEWTPIGFNIHCPSRVTSIKVKLSCGGLADVRFSGISLVRGAEYEESECPHRGKACRVFSPSEGISYQLFDDDGLRYRAIGQSGAMAEESHSADFQATSDSLLPFRQGSTSFAAKRFVEGRRSKLGPSSAALVRSVSRSGLTRTETDEDGVSFAQTLDSSGRVVSAAPSGESAAFYQYLSNGDLGQIDRGASALSYDYDAKRRLSDIDSASGVFYQYLRDTGGVHLRVKLGTSALYSSQHFSVTSGGNSIVLEGAPSSVSFLGETLEFAYDGDWLPISRRRNGADSLAISYDDAESPFLMSDREASEDVFAISSSTLRVGSGGSLVSYSEGRRAFVPGASWSLEQHGPSAMVRTGFAGCAVDGSLGSLGEDGLADCGYEVIRHFRPRFAKSGAVVSSANAELEENGHMWIKSGGYATFSVDDFNRKRDGLGGFSWDAWKDAFTDGFTLYAWVQAVPGYHDGDVLLGLRKNGGWGFKVTMGQGPVTMAAYGTTHTFPGAYTPGDHVFVAMSVRMEGNRCYATFRVNATVFSTDFLVGVAPSFFDELAIGDPTGGLCAAYYVKEVGFTTEAGAEASLARLYRKGAPSPSQISAAEYRDLSSIPGLRAIALDGTVSSSSGLKPITFPAPRFVLRRGLVWYSSVDESRPPLAYRLGIAGSGTVSLSIYHPAAFGSGTRVFSFSSEDGSSEPLYAYMADANSVVVCANGQTITVSVSGSEYWRTLSLAFDGSGVTVVYGNGAASTLSLSAPLDLSSSVFVLGGRKTGAYSYGCRLLTYFRDLYYAARRVGQDELARLAGKKNEAGVSVQFDALSRPSSRKYSNGVSSRTESFTYQTAGGNATRRVASHTSISGRTYTYEYSSSGKVSRILIKKSGQTVSDERFTYDGLGRLSSATTGGASVSFAYDGDGNLASEGQSVYSYGQTSTTYQLLTGRTNGSYSISYGSSTDARKPIHILRPDSSLSLSWDGSRLAGAGGCAYAYYCSGLRRSKTAPTATFYYQYEGERVAYVREVGPSGATASAVRVLYDEAGSAFGFFLDEEPYFYERDLIGRIMAVVDAQGNARAWYSYDAWGVPAFFDDGTDLGARIRAKNPLIYKGYVYDPETRFYYLNSRYYCPELRRFLTSDDVFPEEGELPEFNIYAYCFNDPITYADPTGHMPDWAKWLTGGVAFVGALALTYLTGGALAPLLIGMGVSVLGGGIVQGAATVSNGGDFWEGFNHGAADGAMWGGLFALAGAGFRTIKMFRHGVALGESMKRVRMFARASGQITYNGMPAFNIISRIFDEETAVRMAMSHNAHFIQRMMRWGVTLVDYGIDVTRIDGRSDFYAMERGLFAGYEFLETMLLWGGFR